MEIAEGLEWRRIYYVRGQTPKGSSYRNEISDPPCAGWQHALVIKGERRSTIFCPYSMQSFNVRATADEIEKSEPPTENRDAQWIADLLTRKWNEFQAQGFERDYQTAAVIFKKLGAPIPPQLVKGGGEDTRKRGGKETGRKLLKPVKLKSKRGRFLKWFMDGDNARSVREAMAEFSMTRSNALSYLYMLQKDHGIGYALVGDTATIEMPDGCTNPFDEAIEQEIEVGQDDDWLEDPAKAEAEDDDDDWL